MTDTTITVQGRFTAYYPAERATVEVSIHHENAERQAAFDATIASAGIVRELVTTLHSPDSGPVTWWSSETAQVWAEKPWNNEGVQLPPVFHARLTFTVKFSDFSALGQWIESVSDVSGVSVDGIAWALTDARRAGLTAEVRSRAVKDAVAKASVYAQSIGLGSVSAVAIADPGMLGDQVHSGATSEAPGMMRMNKTTALGEPTLSLKPDDIEVSATVDARFIAS